MNTFFKLNRFVALCLIPLALSSFSNNPAVSQEAQALEFSVLQQLPHSQQNFTQGLFFYDGNLYESTGQYGRSKLIRYDKDFSTPLMARSVAAKYFAEGATAHNGVIYQLTWQAEIALAYEPRRLSKREGFSYQGQGWGLSSDGEHLWLSDGTSTLKKLGTDGAVLSSINISMNEVPLERLNELEWVNGKIYANRWYDNRIYVIEPSSGMVTHYLNLDSLAKPELADGQENVLNGIAWNPDTETLWITGKNWRYLFELKLAEHR